MTSEIWRRIRVFSGGELKVWIYINVNGPSDKEELVREIGPRAYHNALSLEKRGILVVISEEYVLIDDYNVFGREIIDVGGVESENELHIVKGDPKKIFSEILESTEDAGKEEEKKEERKPTKEEKEKYNYIMGLIYDINGVYREGGEGHTKEDLCRIEGVRWMYNLYNK